VVPGIHLGVGLIFLGGVGVILIPAINTFLLGVSIAMLCTGISLIMATLILVHQDRQEACKEGVEVAQQIENLTNQKNESEDELFDAYNEIRAINFTSC
jgi:hypothetical protein